MELLDNHWINVWRRRQIEQTVPVEIVCAVQFFQSLLQVFKRFRIMIFTRYVGQGLREFLALDFIIIRTGFSGLLYGIDCRFLKCIVGHGSACESYDCESPRQAILRRQTVQGRDQFPARKVTRGPKDHDGARISGSARTLFHRCHSCGDSVFA